MGQWEEGDLGGTGACQVCQAYQEYHVNNITSLSYHCHDRQLEVIDWRLDGQVNSQREVEVIDLDETDGGDGQEVETDGGDGEEVEVVSKDPECNLVRFASYRPRAS